MKKILFLMFTAALLVYSSPGFTQKKNQLDGVWKVVEVTIPGAIRSPSSSMKDTTIGNPQPGLLIFTKGYYSVNVLRGTQPRSAVEAAKDPNNLTDAEKLARFDEWQPLVANSGTYETKGSTIVRHPVVAKSVEVMNARDPLTQEFKIEGNSTLFLNPTPEHAKTEPRIKLIRVE